MTQNIVSFDCRYCGQPRALIHTIGTAHAPAGVYGGTQLVIWKATCGHIPVTFVDGSVLPANFNSLFLQVETISDLQSQNIVLISLSEDVAANFQKEEKKLKNFSNL